VRPTKKDRVAAKLPAEDGWIALHAVPKDKPDKLGIATVELTAVAIAAWGLVAPAPVRATFADIFSGIPGGTGATWWPIDEHGEWIDSTTLRCIEFLEDGDAALNFYARVRGEMAGEVWRTRSQNYDWDQERIVAPKQRAREQAQRQREVDERAAARAKAST
jgi:hypothetical protein